MIKHTLALALFVLLAFGGVGFVPSQAVATQEVIYLTQIFPSPASGQEWIEIYNPSSTTIDLTGWIIEDQLSSASVAVTLNQSILPMTTLHIELPIAKLNNSGDGVTLKNSSGMVVDNMSYSSTTTDLSWLRSDLSAESGWTKTSPIVNYVPPAPTSISATPTLTPEPTSMPVPTTAPTPSTLPNPSPTPVSETEQGVILTISSFMPCPNENEPEWVEIFNPNKLAVNLAGWKIVDKNNNTIALTDSIDPEKHLAVDLDNYILNNSGDELSLLDPFSQEIDHVSYADICQTGLPFEKLENIWESTHTNSAHNYRALTSSPGPSSTPIVNNSPPTTRFQSPTINWWKAPDINQINLVQSGELQVLGKVSETQKTTLTAPTKLPKNTFQSAIMGGLCLVASSFSLASAQIKNAYSTLISHIH